MISLLLSILFFPVAVLIWIVTIAFTVWVSVEGAKRKIGGTTACLISLFISPLVALIVVLVSPKAEEQVLVITPQSQPDKLDQLSKLAQLKNSGLLSEEEIEAEKEKIMNTASEPTIITVQSAQVITPGKSPEDYFAEGNDFEQAEKYQQALYAYTNAIGLKPDYTAAYFKRALVYAKLTYPEKAITDYTSVITLDPVNAPAYNNRGKLLETIGRHEDAYADIKKAADFGFAPAVKWIDQRNASVQS